MRDLDASVVVIRLSFSTHDCEEHLEWRVRKQRIAKSRKTLNVKTGNPGVLKQKTEAKMDTKTCELISD